MVGDAPLPPLRTGDARPSAELLASRARASTPSGEPDGRLDLGGVEALAVGAQRVGSGPSVLYFHGGGYRMGAPEAWIAYARRLAETADTRVILPRYRLAPEAPFPAALHDALAAYRALAAQGPVVLAGDSAGAGLAAGLCVALHRAGEQADGLILISPMLDLEALDATYDSHAESDRIFSRAAVLGCAELYLQGHPPGDPLVSPLRAAPDAFPPTLALVGGAEVLVGEVLAFVGRLALAGRSISLHMPATQGHAWPMLAAGTPAAEEAMAVMGGFVRARTRATGRAVG